MAPSDIFCNFASGLVVRPNKKLPSHWLDPFLLPTRFLSDERQTHLAVSDAVARKTPLPRAALHETKIKCETANKNLNKCPGSPKWEMMGHDATTFWICLDISISGVFLNYNSGGFQWLDL